MLKVFNDVGLCNQLNQNKQRKGKGTKTNTKKTKKYETVVEINSNVNHARHSFLFKYLHFFL